MLTSWGVKHLLMYLYHWGEWRQKKRKTTAFKGPIKKARWSVWSLEKYEAWEVDTDWAEAAFNHLSWGVKPLYSVHIKAHRWVDHCTCVYSMFRPSAAQPWQWLWMTGTGWCCLWWCGDVRACMPSSLPSSLRCVSSPQPLVWWIPSPAARERHDLLAHSGADWLHYRPYINLVGEKLLERRRMQTFQRDRTSCKICSFISGW